MNHRVQRSGNQHSGQCLCPFPLPFVWPLALPLPLPGLVGDGFGLVDATGAAAVVDVVVGAGFDTVPAPERDPVVAPLVVPVVRVCVWVHPRDGTGRSATETEGEACLPGCGVGVASGTATS